MSVAIVQQPIKTELSRAFHYWPRPLAQKYFVTPKSVVFPQMLAKPRAANGPVGPDRIAFPPIAHRSALPPKVSVMVRAPSACAVVYFSRATTVDGQIANEFQERLVAFGQVGDLSGPVVH